MADITIEDADEILARAIQRLQDNSQLTRFTSGSKAQALLGVMASEVERLGEVVTANLVLSLLNGASGVYLDFLGDLVGIPRQAARPASALGASSILKVSGPGEETAGELNSGEPIVIPGGTLLTSQDGTFIYSTIGSVTWLATDEEVSISARSVRVGEDGNISAGTLNSISFTGYAAHPALKLTVTQQSAIENGVSADPDDLYRFRIQNAVLAAEQANATSVRLAALSIPAVADAVALPLFRGIGTADIIIDTILGEVTADTVDQVRSVIARTSALGMDLDVRAPKLIGLELVFTVKFVNGASERIKAEAKTALRSVISDLVAEVSMGGYMTVNDIAFGARNAHQAIADIGRPNRPIDEVVIWRPSVVRSRTPFLLPDGKNINLEFDERLLLEGSPTEAVVVVE